MLPRADYLLYALRQAGLNPELPLTPAALITFVVLDEAKGSPDVTAMLARYVSVRRELLAAPEGFEVLASVLTYVWTVR